MSRQLTNALLGFLASGAALGAMALADPPQASSDPVWVQMDQCQYEDGNPDGSVCLWVNSDGEGFVNDSSNYR